MFLLSATCAMTETFWESFAIRNRKRLDLSSWNANEQISFELTFHLNKVLLSNSSSVLKYKIFSTCNQLWSTSDEKLIRWLLWHPRCNYYSFIYLHIHWIKSWRIMVWNVEWLVTRDLINHQIKRSISISDTSIPYHLRYFEDKLSAHS